MPESPDRIQAAIDKLLAEAPPLSRGQEQLLTRILHSPPSNIVPPPADPDPDPPLIDPPPGSHYSQRMRATAGICQLCQHDRPRVVDHCHRHGRVRGHICAICNAKFSLRRGFVALELQPVIAAYMRQCPACPKLYT
jgi:Recombination endonuclease VII